MRGISMLVAMGLVAGCVEYDVASSAPLVGEFNEYVPDNPVNEDSIVQVTVQRTDVLFIVDDSSSMEPEQSDLAEAFPQFMNFFLDSGLDYHIGVVSTDMDDPSDSGKLQAGLGVLYIDPDTINPMGVFQDMAEMGGYGDSYESGRAAAYVAIGERNNGFNAGFYREDASLHVVVMSDENDWSDHWGIITQSEFIDWMLTLKAKPDMVTFNSIVNMPGCCNGNQNAFSESAGTRYLEITDAVGGIAWDIKAGQWAEVLEQLGIQAAGLSREFFLSQLPTPGTIEVWIHTDGIERDFLEGVDWAYDAQRNSVVFAEYLPQPLSEIKISYEVLSGQFLVTEGPGA